MKSNVAFLVFVLGLLAAPRVSFAGRVTFRSAHVRLGAEAVHTVTKAKADAEPMFTEETMPPVSTTMQCVINLTVQYFAVYTALAILRTVNQFADKKYAGIEAIVKSASATVNAATMISVLFLGARMRAIQLSQGETEKHDLPQPWVKMAMQISAYAVLGQVLMVLVIPVFSGETTVEADAEGNVDIEKLPEMNKGVTIGLSVVRYVLMACLYGGIATVMVGIIMMEGPKEIWGDAVPPVSPAVGATMNLSIQFFVVYLMVAISRTMKQLMPGQGVWLTKLEETFKQANITLQMAPMLCILFIGARMRALQIDPKHGNPQRWAQLCFYMCAYSVLFQAILVVALPYVKSECTVKPGSVVGDVIFEGLSGPVATCVTVFRYLALLALYGGFTAVMVSVFIIEHPDGAEMTPKISPAMSCVMNLTIQYFTIFLVLFLIVSCQQLTGIQFPTTAAAMDSAQKTVMYAPMLSILFVGTRMRALQLTKAQDGTVPITAGPQPWAQDCMFLCTWAVLIQVLMVLVMSAMHDKIEMDDDGNMKTPENANKIVGGIITFLRYASMIAMYGGVGVIVYAVFAMTPETLPPYASDNLIPGVESGVVPQPPTPPTPSF